jgi:hypothetical protein
MHASHIGGARSGQIEDDKPYPDLQDKRFNRCNFDKLSDNKHDVIMHEIDKWDKNPRIKSASDLKDSKAIFSSAIEIYSIEQR